MLFPTFEFFLFFTVVLILNWYFKRWPLVWRLFLVLVSYFFYSLFDVRFLLIIFIVSLFNFFSGKFIYENIFNKRRLVFILTITANLLVLGIFKYYDFFRLPIESFLQKVGFPVTIPFLEIILPVGLSFYIFRTISYNIDIYLKKIAPASSIVDFLIYVAFFPQLLSGPIARAGEFLPQLKDGGSQTIENLHLNLTLILLGLFKKLVISSYLVLNITDDVFAVPENHSSSLIFLAIFAYSLVIYFDFSGYSDMAIGFAGLMGFKSPINFNFPYLAQDVQDFWRRWHITLSNWIRDYVYIPLGGNRRGKIRQYLNLMIAMLLVGLWHGAAGHFIAWGGLQGIGMVGTHIYKDRKKPSLNSRGNQLFFGRLGAILSKLFWWFLTFIFISFAWIFFRSTSIENAVNFIKNLFAFGRLNEPIQICVIIFIILGFTVFLLEKQIISGLVKIQEKLPKIIWFIFIIFLFILIFSLGPDTLPPFIYFGF